MDKNQAMLVCVILSFILGVFGQGIRVIAGLKKQSDESVGTGKSISQDFNNSKFQISLFIGGISGVGAFFSYFVNDNSVLSDMAKFPIISGILAAGYAGADFIEAFVNKYIPSNTIISKTTVEAPKNS